MPSALDLYKSMMSLLQKKSSPTPLMQFVQHQLLSLMRGVQITDEDKISSMVILLTAAERVAKRKQDANHETFVKAIMEISRDTETIDAHRKRIAETQFYIEKLLSDKIDKYDLKKKFDGKPWLLQSKHSPSDRGHVGLKKPETNLPGSGLIPTRCDKGWEFPPVDSDIFFKSFRKQVCGLGKKRVLILGAGYGTSVHGLLKSSVRSESKFTINDLSSEQMHIFKDELSNQFDDRVTIITGNFLDDVNFPNEHFDHILMQNVMHFFPPEQVDLCLERIYAWLKPGGKLTLSVVTPYAEINTGPGGFIKKYEICKQLGDPNPGFIANVKEHLAQRKHPMAEKAPNSALNVFDVDTLSAKLKQHKFAVTKCKFFAAPETHPKAFKLDGEELVGALAYKPRV